MQPPAMATPQPPKLRALPVQMQAVVLHCLMAEAAGVAACSRGHPTGLQGLFIMSTTPLSSQLKGHG